MKRIILSLLMLICISSSYAATDDPLPTQCPANPSAADSWWVALGMPSGNLQYSLVLTSIQEVYCVYDFSPPTFGFLQGNNFMATPTMNTGWQRISGKQVCLLDSSCYKCAASNTCEFTSQASQQTLSMMSFLKLKNNP